MRGLGDRAVRLREAVEEEGGTFGVFSARKDAVIALGSPASNLGGLTPIQAAWAVANYFKHREEWSGAWEEAVACSIFMRSAALGRLEVGVTSGCGFPASRTPPPT